MTGEAIRASLDAHHIDVYARHPVVFVSGSGATLTDADGKTYLDFFCGLAVTSLGHAHPRIVEAVGSQIARLAHVSNLFYVEPQARLADLLVESSFADRVFFANSGAEANEAAIKLIRRWGAGPGGGRYEILTTSGSFHGRTMATVSATAQEKHQAGFHPMLEGFRYVPFGDADALEAAVSDRTIAVLVEPIQGEGGVNLPPAGYLRDLRRICDDHELLLALDEVQVGVGRTGKLFAHEHEGVAPDVMTLAKALGGGLPIGAMLTTERVAPSLDRGSHGSTFGGNPVSCAAAVAVLEELRSTDVLENAVRVGRSMLERARSWQAEMAGIVDVRGVGMILGIELDRDGADVVTKALERGLVVNCAAGRVIRLLPPLILTEAEAERGMDLLEEILREVLS